jgi:hypothetical protein
VHGLVYEDGMYVKTGEGWKPFRWSAKDGCG